MSPTHHVNPIPNILTGLRLVAGVVMFLILAGATGGVPILSSYLSPEDQFGLYRAAFYIFVVAASTDWVDGYLARRWHAETRWGAILDPIADKVLVTGAILGVLTSGSVPQIAIPCGLILFREFAVSALRETIAGGSRSKSPCWPSGRRPSSWWRWAPSCSPATGTASASTSNTCPGSSWSPTA